jgi:hypothetical protein
VTIRAYIATEGPHDVEFLAALLRPLGFRRLQKEADLDPYWAPLIPRTFPHDGDLLKRMPVPTFFANKTHSVALDSATGIDNLYQRIEENIAVLAVPPALPAIAVVLDADDEDASERFADLAQRLRSLGLPIPSAPGQVSSALPHCGIFVLPDNASKGTLESLLEECAALAYPSLLEHATAYIAGIDSLGIARSELRELNKPAGRAKAKIAAMASVLKPGRAIQVSLQDNQWLRGAALQLPRILAVRDFLAALLELPPAST